MPSMTKLKPRPLYLQKLISVKDTEFIKVIVGMRRCGKSSLLELFSSHLKNTGISPEQIIKINFEAAEFLTLTDYQKLLEYVQPLLNDGPSNKKYYLMFDEIQLVDQWERAVNALRMRDNADIYLTGSNAHMLSSQLATLLSGRYIELNVYPLSFSEYMSFIDAESANEELLQNYIHFGGLPPVVAQGNNHELANIVLNGIYNTIVVKDIEQHVQVRNQLVFKNIAEYLADIAGSNVSISNIENRLKSAHRKTANETIEKYINALVDAFLFYRAKRFDLKGGAILQGLEKYYPADLGIRNMLLGFPKRNFGFVLENLIYNELIVRGYTVEIGKIDNLEIDFIARKSEEILYIQACASMLDEETNKRELAALQRINDTKAQILIITYDRVGLGTQNGIEVINVIEWLLS